jgi:hypothetical protein
LAAHTEEGGVGHGGGGGRVMVAVATDLRRDTTRSWAVWARKVSHDEKLDGPLE